MVPGISPGHSTKIKRNVQNKEKWWHFLPAGTTTRMSLVLHLLSLSNISEEKHISILPFFTGPRPINPLKTGLCFVLSRPWKVHAKVLTTLTWRHHSRRNSILVGAHYQIGCLILILEAPNAFMKVMEISSMWKINFQQSQDKNVHWSNPDTAYTVWEVPKYPWDGTQKNWQENPLFV